MIKHSILPFFISHQGCPHQCVFCDQRIITGINQVVTPEYIFDKINEFTQRESSSTDYREIAYYGGTFTALAEDRQAELLWPAKEALQKGKIRRIRVSTRPDYINKDTLHLLRSYNVSLVELGIQSLDQEVLYQSGRGHTREESLFAIDMLKEQGFEVGAQLMIGLPGDNIDKSINTCREIIKKKPNYVRIYPTLVLKGTLLEKMFQKRDYFPMTLFDAVAVSKQMVMQFMDAQIKLIRIGLHPGQDLQKEGLILAGPFHPAFGELVKSELALDLLIFTIKSLDKKKEDVVSIYVPANETSIFIGQKKKNLSYLSSLFPNLRIKIVSAPLLNKINIRFERDSRESTIHYLNGFKPKI